MFRRAMVNITLQTRGKMRRIRSSASTFDALKIIVIDGLVA